MQRGGAIVLMRQRNSANTLLHNSTQEMKQKRTLFPFLRGKCFRAFALSQPSSQCSVQVSIKAFIRVRFLIETLIRLKNEYAKSVPDQFS